MSSPCHHDIESQQPSAPPMPTSQVVETEYSKRLPATPTSVVYINSGDCTSPVSPDHRPRSFSVSSSDSLANENPHQVRQEVQLTQHALEAHHGHQPNKRQRWPIMTISLVLLIWIIFILGNVQQDRESHIKASWPTWYDRISPSNMRWWYYAVLPWPQCNDVRHQGWRLISMQFTHSGFEHIIGNTLSALGYGSIIEMYLPYGHFTIFTIFQLSILFGTMGFNLLWPYSGLIGASPGVYGLIGGCISTVLFNRITLDPIVVFVLPIVILSQILADIVFYAISYSPQIGYASHVFGGITGFLLTTSILVYQSHHTEPRHRLMRILSFTAKGLLAVMIILLIYHYRIIFPIINHKQYLSSSTILHNANVLQTDCCAQMYTLLEERSDLTMKQVKETGYCHKHVLYSPFIYVESTKHETKRLFENQKIDYLGRIEDVVKDNVYLG